MAADGTSSSSVFVPMLTYTQGLAETADLVIGCCLSQYTRFQGALDDVASNVCQALPALA
jgi:hypothetical protein